MNIHKRHTKHSKFKVKTFDNANYKITLAIDSEASVRRAAHQGDTVALFYIYVRNILQ